MRKAGVPCTEISVAEALRREPLLNPRISRVFEVPDGSADSFLATHATAQAARQAGAQILVYHEVVDVADRGRRRATARRDGAKVRDLASGEEIAIHADMTINASGAWAGKIAALAGVDGQRHPRQGHDGRHEPPRGQHGDQPLQDARRRRHHRARSTRSP